MASIRATRCLAGVAMCLATGAATHAEDADSAIARCARIASVGDRILCLENALRQNDDAGENISSSTIEDLLPVQEPVEAVVAIERDSQIEVPDTEVPEAPAVTQTVSDAVTPEVGLLSESSIDDFGANAETRKKKEPDSIDVRIVSVDKDPYGKFLFRTEGGQVWQQTDKKSSRYRQIPFDAQIRSATAGSFFLRPLTGGVSIRVKRKR